MSKRWWTESGGFDKAMMGKLVCIFYVVVVFEAGEVKTSIRLGE